MGMANVKNTPTTRPTTNQNGSPATGGKRETIALPTLTVEEAPAELTISKGPGAVNPMIPFMEVANANKGKTYQVQGIENERQANKVINLLQRAFQPTPNSVRSQYRKDKGVVLFVAVDKIVRKASTPAPDA